jgi:hypothetical protein
MLLTGVNSPVQEEEMITTTYIESPQYRAAQQSTRSGVDSHPGGGDRRCQYLPQEAGERVGWQHQDVFDWCQTGELPGISEELLDFDNTADWDLDFLSAYPTQMV